MLKVTPLVNLRARIQVQVCPCPSLQLSLTAASRGSLCHLSTCFSYYILGALKVGVVM